MQYHECRPPSILQESVKCFWTHEATYSADEIQEITPDGCVELIFNFGSPYQLWSTTPPAVLPPLAPPAVVVLAPPAVVVLAPPAVVVLAPPAVVVLAPPAVVV